MNNTLTTKEATIPVEQTSTYPTRYAAFDRPGVLFVHDAPKQSGGHEWAVFNWEDKAKGRYVYGSIVSYQDQGFYLEVAVGPSLGSGQCRYSERMPYNYDHAQRKLIEELTKHLPARASEETWGQWADRISTISKQPHHKRKA